MIKASNKAARDALITDNIRLIDGVIKAMWPHFASVRAMGRAEAFSAGQLGLIDAADGFDPTLGNKFCTYAWYAIRRRIRKASEDVGAIRVPHRAHEGRYAAQAHKATDSGLRPTDWDQMEELLFTEERPQADEPPDLAPHLAKLEPRERRVIELHFGLGSNRPMSLREVGECEGMTKERARQLVGQAMAKLRAAMGVNLPETETGAKP